MYAVCYQYPNGEGGNITAQNSASDVVSMKQVLRFFDEVKPSSDGVVLSAPEVPIDTRLFLLKKGRELGCFTVASLLVSEVEEFAELNAFTLVDLLAINQDEALAIANLLPEVEGESDADRCYRYLKSLNSGICVIVTCGGEGAYTYQKGQKWFSPGVRNTVLNTAGAGDCLLGTVISALIHRLPLTQDAENATVSSAVQLAVLAAAMKVACNDTIDFSIDKHSLLKFARGKGIEISDNVIKRFFQV